MDYRELIDASYNLKNTDNAGIQELKVSLTHHKEIYKGMYEVAVQKGRRSMAALYEEKLLEVQDAISACNATLELRKDAEMNA